MLMQKPVPVSKRGTGFCMITEKTGNQGGLFIFPGKHFRKIGVRCER